MMSWPCLSPTGCPRSTRPCRTVLTASDDDLSLDELLPKLLVVENEDSKPVPESKAFVARPGMAPGHANNPGACQHGTDRSIWKEPKGDPQVPFLWQAWASQEGLLEAPA